MNTLKKVWINKSGDDIYSLSLESNQIDHNRLKASELTFPANNPTRHTVALTYLGFSDLVMLYYAIEEELNK